MHKLHPDQMVDYSAESWWTKYDDDEEMANAMHRAKDAVDDDTADLQREIVKAMLAYDPAARSVPVHLVRDRKGPKPRENLVAGVIDSWIAQVAHEKPRTMFMTTGGSATEQKRTRDITHYCDAKNDEANTLAIRRKCLRDAGLHGLGHYRWVVDHTGKRIWCERTHPLNLLLDEPAGTDARPVCMYIKHSFDKRTLMAMWPDHAEVISVLQHPNMTGSVIADPNADVVEVVEAWHLPSLPANAYKDRDEYEAKTDGVHTFGVRGATFFKEKYLERDFPGVFMTAIPSDSGLRGPSLYSRLKSLQNESDKLQAWYSNAMNIMSSPRWAMKVGDFAGAQMVNNIGALIKTKSGNPPTPLTARAMNPEVNERLAELRRIAFAVAGISEHFAGAMKTPNVNSGRQELITMDNRSRRLVEHVDMYERASVEGDYDLIKRTRELDAWMRANDKGSLAILYKRKGVPHEVPWHKLNVDDERLMVQAFPTSMAMRDPGTKLKMLGEWLKTGIITNDQYARLMDFPEIESEQRLMTAPRDWLEEAWDAALTGEEFMAPDAALDPKLVMQLTPRAILRAMLDGHTEAEVNRLRSWFKQAEVALKPPLPEPPMDPMAGGLPPDGMPPEGMGPPPGAMPPPGGPPMPPMGGMPGMN